MENLYLKKFSFSFQALLIVYCGKCLFKCHQIAADLKSKQRIFESLENPVVLKQLKSLEQANCSLPFFFIPAGSE